MLCESLLLRIILLVSSLLAVTSPTDNHNLFKQTYMKRSKGGVGQHKPGSKPGSVFCGVSQKSSNMASNAATEAKAAKEVQISCGEEVGLQMKEQLTIQVAKAAEAVCKKQILEQLQGRLCENNKVIEEIKNATSASQSAMETATRAALTIKRHKEKLKILIDDVVGNMENIRRLATNARQEVIDKRTLRDAVKRRVEELRMCLKQAQNDLDRTEDSAKKASSAAEVAKQRIDLKRQIRYKLKILKKRDLQRLSRFLQTRSKEK